MIRIGAGAGVPARALARELGVSQGVVRRELIKLGRIPDRVRKAADFAAALPVPPPRRQQPKDSWTLETVRLARDNQMRGYFALPVRLAEMLRTDDALFNAYHARLAPQSAVATKLVPNGGIRGDAVSRKASSSIISPRDILSGLNGTMANHGVAIGYNEHEISDDGTRIDFRLTEWPLEWVRYNHSTEQLETSTRNGIRVPIVHGDGRWVVFRKFSTLPWVQEACVLPGSFVWAAHAEGLKNWGAASTSHGLAKIMGELPEGVSLLADENGTLTAEARAFLQMLQDVVSGEAGAGIRPAGSKTDMLTNSSTAWQVFSELILSREKAAARIYTGTDAILGAAGGAPGVDISELFGVASTKVQGDFEAIEQAWYTGVSQPWTAMNEGDSRYAPRLKYQLPDPDAKQKSEENAAKRIRLFDTLDRMATRGFTIDQPTVDALCCEYGIDTPPQLSVAGNQNGTTTAGTYGRGEGGARA